MSHTTGALTSLLGTSIRWIVKYVFWLILTAAVTLGGGLVLMLFKDWGFQVLATALLAWPLLGLAMLVAVPAAFLPLGRVYLGSALAGGLLYNLVLLIA